MAGAAGYAAGGAELSIGGAVMAAFDYAISVLADPDFISSLDDGDEAPEPIAPDAWSDPRTLRSHTRVPGLDFYTDRKRDRIMWRVRWPRGDGTYGTAARDDLSRALDVWAAHYEDIKRARAVLEARGLL